MATVPLSAVAFPAAFPPNRAKGPVLRLTVSLPVPIAVSLRLCASAPVPMATELLEDAFDPPPIATDKSPTASACDDFR